MDDLISRQAAIDMIANNHYSLEYCIEHHIEFSIDVSLAIAKLSELPSAQPDTTAPTTDTTADTISRQSVLSYIDRIKHQGTGKEKSFDFLEKYVSKLPSAQPEWNNHTVACLLADLFDDTCACNYNGIDEWLPIKCELLDTCPNPVGVACWEQFLKHRAERRTDEPDR